MDVNITTQSKSGSSQDSVLDQVFINVLQHDTHGPIHCQPLTVTLLCYYDNQHTVKLNWRTKTTKKSRPIP